MPDPYVFGPDAGADRWQQAATRAELEAGAYARAYLAHGDQLGALEAEAYIAEVRKRNHGIARVRRALAMMLGPWADP